MIVLSILFYLFGLLAVLYEICVIGSPQRIDRLRKKLRATKYDGMTNEMKTVTLLMFGYALWALMGIMSSQYLPFLAILLLSFIPKRGAVLVWIDALLTLSLLIVIYVNRFHIHYNWTDLISKYLSL